uniref:Haem-binding uptake Tiki superfamily ChaN domain-containing protein n=1 Tax=Tetradesmus obliquus TaxID=3088 RepID=A0A383VZU2_TETOB|eukprot:jgi/Sobl393_1/2211/SZX70440.1
MWQRSAGVLAAVLAAKAHQRCHVLAEAGVPIPAKNIYTASQQSLSPGNTTSSSANSEPAGQSSAQDLHQDPSNSSSSSSSSSKLSKWPPSLKEGTHFAVLTGDGVPARLSSIVAAMQAADVVLLGEFHDDPVAHALQLDLLKRTAKALGYQTPTQAAAAAAAAADGPAGQHGQPAMQQQQLQQDGSSKSQASRAPPAASHAAGTTQNQQQQQQQQQQQGEPVRHPLRPLVLGLEMFERDVQPVLDEYLAGSISLADLMRDGRPWPNYRRDYQPLVDFCKGLAALHNNTAAAAAAAAAAAGVQGGSYSSASDTSAPTPADSSSSSRNCVRVIAANAPRRYVSLAGRAGRQALLQLPPAAQQFLAPLPYAQPSQEYVAKVTGSMRQAAADMQRHREQQQQQQQQQQPAADSGAAAMRHSSTPAPAAAAAAAAAGGPADGGACPYIGFNVSSNFLDAQCLWDSTMAHSIAQQLTAGAANTVTPAAAAGSNTASSTAGNTCGSTASSTASSTTGSTLSGTSQQQQPQQQRGPLVVHVCGKFHAEHHLGIPEHLQLYAPGARVVVVTFVPADSMTMEQQQLEAAGLLGSADFVVLTDGRLPRSFASVHPV